VAVTKERAQVRRRAKRPPTFEQFFAIRRFQPTVAFTSDGRRVLFSTNISGQFNLWEMRLRGGWPRQLTTFEEQTVRSVAVARDGKAIVFTADHDGDEFHQIYALLPGGGWPEAWTDAREVQHYVLATAWSPDGRRLAFSANAREPTDMDVWIRDVPTGEVRQLFGGEMYAFPGEWSPDGERILVVDVRSNTDSSIHLVDAETGEGRELTPHEGETVYEPGPWAADGSGFYLVSDEGREFRGLAFYRLDGELEWIETPDGDVEELVGSADGRYLAWLENEDGWFRLRIRETETGRTAVDPQLPRGTRFPLGTGLTLSPDGSHAALVWYSPRRPPELYVVDTETGKARRLTDSMLGGLRERDLVEPELVAFPTFDGRETPAWLYRPRRRGRVPAVLAIHGGPESQERPIYVAHYQFLLSRGIAILAPNIRGSSGYGKSYQSLIHRDWGGGDLEDLRHAAEWLRAQEWVDEKRIGIFGGSYGGFATLSCVTRLPDYWAAAVDIFGPSNLVTFAKAVPPTWRRFMARWVGDPDADADFLLERSPITYVENVKAPLLVIQGATDPRVVKGESDQMVERLRALGREVEYVVFDDEGHGFTKRRNELQAFRAAVDWLERHLVG
jgi:dipeptidyl aminopeptidase/acylaminoacyl peptidase